jgi:putative ABC transport system ATP-binding protein
VRRSSSGGANMKNKEARFKMNRTENAAIVSLRTVRKEYRLGQTLVPALRGVSFDIHRGEFTALVGSSGSGKSTLLNIVGLVDTPTSGAVLLEGEDVSALNERGLARLRNQKLGYVFQSFNLIPVLSAFENVEVPLLLRKELSRDERRERVAAALEDVGLGEHARKRPDTLSGGQRQRVAIARALVGRPRLVLADEPTANLDSVTAHTIIDVCLELNAKRGVTFLFSTHDEKLMERVSRRIRIQDGRVVEQ